MENIPMDSSLIQLTDKIKDTYSLRKRYKKKFGTLPDLRTPVTYNEKIQWIKLNCRIPLYTLLADKYAVRAYVAERVGEEHLVELYDVFDHWDIDFDALPESFVLRATHGCKWNIICKDKNTLDVDEAKRKMRKWFNSNFYAQHHEWQYKHIPPRFVCEKYLEDESGHLTDYKFICVGGEPLFLSAQRDRDNDKGYRYFNSEWQLLPFDQGIAPKWDSLPRPDGLEKMFDIARALSSGLPMVRVDLYNVYGKIIFGEMTLTPGNGFRGFRPSEYDKTLGDMINLEGFKNLMA
jgi:hypothetical protein